ncbi:MAG: substrate-binding domain-containing protein [Thermodesulfovibrionales bacterium]
MRLSRSYLSSLLIVLVFIGMASISYGQEKCTEVYGNGKDRFSLATGSPGELGILKVLGETFSREMDAQLCWIKAGTGDSLKLLKEKFVDMIMVHAPKAEKKAVSDGWATKRTLIGSNEFFIVGPPDDPARIAEAKNASDAYALIAKAKAKFFSRGDNSGTHKKEMELWEKTGISPGGDWYIVTKDFMTATLKRANNEKGYFMTDSSTWAAEKKNLSKLSILFRGDKFLVNTYHALSQPAGATHGASISSKFIDFIASERGQKIIREFGRELYGEGLYNDAAYAKKYDD